MDNPTGTITFLLTDVEGSTSLWEAHPQEMRAALVRHDALGAEIVQQNSGTLIRERGEGDSLFAVFAQATNAVAAASALQRAISTEPWPAETPLRVRMALHTGEADFRDGDYYGASVNRCARLRSAAHGGQTLLSGATYGVARSGLPSDASARDCGIHRLRDVGEEHIWELVILGLSSDFPPLNTLDPERHNLPIPPTPFIGREAEAPLWTRQVENSLSRLLTFTGAGGIGKTRAALHLAESLVSGYTEGVWWIDLAEVRTGAAIIERVASNLHVHLRPKPSIKEQVCSFLRDRRLLLVLDNVEQIPDAAPVVADLLSAAPHLDLVVTSRRPLEIRAEHVVEIKPLSASDAEILFTERAKTRVSEFSVGENNRADIVRLCSRLEGVPLAIELAASRVTSLSPREILDRLRERFRLLRSGAPDLPARQKALQGTIDWSYDLLTSENRSLLAQLSVFAGGFTLVDAEEVCDCGDILEGVSDLRRNSLLRSEVDSVSQKTRYAMLESVREYAATKLLDLGELGTEARQRHMETFLRFGEASIECMKTARESTALAELDREYDNLAAALRWARNTRQNAESARLALIINHRLYRRGFWAEARRHLEVAVDAAIASGMDQLHLRATAECYLASVLTDMGDLQAARTIADESLCLWREIGDPTGIAESLNTRGIVAVHSADLETAQSLFVEAIGLLDSEDHARRGTVSRNLANLAAARGEAESAERLYAEALHHNRIGGDVRNEAKTLSNMGGLVQNLGDLEKARRLYNQGLAVCRDLNDLSTIAVLLNNLAECCEQAGDIALAVPLFMHSRRIFDEIKSAHVGVPAEALARLAQTQSDEQWAALVRDAESSAWEDLVARLNA